MLAASYALHKFYHDSEETLGRIKEKKNQIPEELGGDYLSVEDYQRKHDIFAQDIKAIEGQVQHYYLFFVCVFHYRAYLTIKKSPRQYPWRYNAVLNFT